jgi:hypothetical protein
LEKDAGALSTSPNKISLSSFLQEPDNTNKTAMNTAKMMFFIVVVF